jgi:glycosyltransferase involved in cell wall biosynthesis
MKVAMIYGNPIGEFYGGISTHVKYLTKYLPNIKDLDLVLVTFGEKNRTYKKDDVEYIELKKMKLGIFSYPLEIFYDMLKLERIIKKINPDVLHIQSTSPNLSIFAIYMKKKYPILITVHGYFAQEYKIQTGWRKMGYKLFCAPIEKYTLMTIPYIIVLSPQMKVLIHIITQSKIYLISNGIDLKYIESITPHERKEDHSIFFLGYITKGKGVVDLIKAIHHAKSKGEKVKLYVGGIGPYLTQLKELVKDLHLQDNVTFLGFLNEEEKFAYMKSMDIFVLPSYWESFPFVLIEAMACGKPIISTDVGGIPFAVSDGVNGFLIQPGNPDEIAEKIIYLFHNKKVMNKMGEESKIKAAEFDWEMITKQTSEVYQDINKN